MILFAPAFSVSVPGRVGECRRLAAHVSSMSVLVVVVSAVLAFDVVFGLVLLNAFRRKERDGSGGFIAREDELVSRKLAEHYAAMRAERGTR